MFQYKDNMTLQEKQNFEEQLKNTYLEHKKETEQDLNLRISGVKGTRGGSGYQFVGYTTLEQFYRGDQWERDEPPGASQRTENYCAKIVDIFSSLLYDAPVEINCPSYDESDDLLEMKAEMKEILLKKIFDDNFADKIVLPRISKSGSLYGDCFIKGPLIDKGKTGKKEDWRIIFSNVENPSNIRLIFDDGNFLELYGFIDTTEISAMKAARKYKEKLSGRGIDIEDLLKKMKARAKSGVRSQPNTASQTTYQPMMQHQEFWTDEIMAIFLEDELVDWYRHDWGFIPLCYIKNGYSPNHPYGKSDLEDVMDPQLFHNRINNDLANAVKFLSTPNLIGKNLDGMEVLVHGLSKIFNLPDDGELEPLQRAGDPYASSNFVDGRRRALLDLSNLSEALMSSVTGGNPSGRAMAMAMQSVIRTLNGKIKEHEAALFRLNKNIFKLLEKYWPETKEIIMGDYTTDVTIVSTLLRNIIDEINKFQSGLQSLTTTQKNLGVPQPKIEQKRMKKDLADPVLGPQTARQPGMLNVRINNPEAAMPGSDEGEQLPATPNQGFTKASPAGAATAANQRASGGAPTAVVE